MLVTEGQGIVNDVEGQNLQNVFENRVTVTNYELVRLSFKNRPNQSWTFRMTKKYYEDNEEEMMVPEQIRAKHILIKSAEEKSLEEAKKKVNEIYSQVKKNPQMISKKILKQC